MRTLIADSRSGLIPLARGTPVNQSPIPLIYLPYSPTKCRAGWDSATYPLDILVRQPANGPLLLGFSHLSP